MAASPTGRYWTLAAALILLAAFGYVAGGLLADSLWDDEAWSAWAVRSPYLADTLARVRADVHPPLYFMLLDVWTLAAGDSPLALRLPSAWFALIGLAAAGATGARLFDRRAGLAAMLLLGASGFFVYYAREARMYSLLLTLATLAAGAYLRWRARPNWRRALAYSGLLAGLFYTHYAGLLVALALALHHSLTRRWRRARPAGRGAPIPYLLAAALALPWLPAALEQLRANPSGPLAAPVATDWGALAALALVTTGGCGGLLLLPFALGSGLPRLRQDWPAALLVGLWLLLPAALLLAANAWLAPAFQVRYVLASLPAGALLAACGLRWLDFAPLRRLGLAVPPTLGTAAAAALLAALVILNVQAYAGIWPGKPPWDEAIQAVIAAREPLEPAITDLAPYSPAAYYDRQRGLRRGIALDLSWRLHTAAEARARVHLLDGAPSVWAILPVNTAKTWHIAAELDRTRAPGYRAALANLIFYRFDRGRPGDLRFRFGDHLRFAGGPGAAEQLTARPGETVCVDLRLEALTALDGRYSAGLHLVDLTGAHMIAQWDGGLGAADAGAVLTPALCLGIPLDAPPGYYHLEWVVYDWRTVERLPVIEDGTGADLVWGDVLVLAAVDVAG